jgi:SAM-dependent methyltransferase
MTNELLFPRKLPGLLGESWMAEVELDHLCHMCSFSPTGNMSPRILEIGSASGVTIGYVARKHPNSEFHCVETFSEDGDQALDTGSLRKKYWNINKSPNMTLYEMDIGSFVCHDPNINFSSFFDIVIVDGGHDFNDVLRDLLVAEPLLRDGGAFLVHDYGDINWFGVQRAVHQLLWKHPKYRVITLKHSLIELRKGVVPEGTQN